jgi:3-oxoacyl-[acyl-carrier-protein] synthase II
VTERREVWVTGVGLLTCLGEGHEAAWLHLERGDPPPYDDKSFAPYIVHQLPPMSFDKQIPKKSDQRQMEMWQRVGVYSAGLALTDAGIAGKAELLDHTDMIVAAGGGERDIAVDTAIMAGVRKTNQPGAFLNERLMSDLRPTLFLAQLPNLLAGNISLVHGIVGSSRTFMGEESAGVDAVRVAQARIAAGQSELTLVGGAYHGTRWDVLLAFELGGVVLKDKFTPVWDRGPQGGIAFATMGAFLVLESKEHAIARGARPHARISPVFSDRNVRKPGET